MSHLVLLLFSISNSMGMDEEYFTLLEQRKAIEANIAICLSNTDHFKAVEKKLDCVK